jgi:predicted neuraminidase
MSPGEWTPAPGREPAKAPGSSALRRTAIFVLPLGLLAPAGVAPPRTGPIVQSEFLFDTAPFASVHASTIVESDSGLVAAWFGGSVEGAADVAIWLSRRVGGRWTAPVQVARGSDPGGARSPCWNPVLFQVGRGMLQLYYKVGPSPSGWRGMVQTSPDGGRNWSAPARLPPGILGPIKDKPLLRFGTLISPSSTESPERRWQIHFELSRDTGRSWTRVAPAAPDAGPRIDAIQPTLLHYQDGRLQALARSRSGRLAETWSRDSGRSWSRVALTALPNPNSGIDAVTLRDGRQLLVYNHTGSGRSPLNVALSVDGRNWRAAIVLEHDPGEYSYPAVIQTADGLVHITYTWRRRRIRHVVLDPGALRGVPIVAGTWPPEAGP